jgi:hypothetical protein
MKTHENYFANVAYRRRFESGLQLAASITYEDRIPLENTSDYTFKKENGQKITPNYPNEKLTEQFIPHQAAVVSISLSYKPGQRFIQFPNFKMSVGSKYPTFTFNYTKGIKNMLGSDVDFDKWKVTIFDDVNMKIAGALKYKFGVGGFLNNKQVFIQDYQHFNGNQITSASEYVNSFQLAPYYAYSTTENFYVFGHIEHHFNGLLTNKIPLFRKLNWNMVVGSNAFFVNKNNNYVELFAGLENILKTIRVDAVIGYDRKNNISTGIRLGLGGLLGGSVSRSNGGVNISF